MNRSRSGSGKKERIRDVSVAGTVRFGDWTRKAADGGKSFVVDTGGGAFIGGNVDTAGGDFVGRDQFTLTRQPDVTLQGFRQLLREIRELVPQAGLDPKCMGYVEGDLQQIEHEIDSERPSAPVLVSKLEGITGIVRSVAGSTEAGRNLLTLLNQGAAWARQLFG